ncbi:bacterial group 3 Ig-like protein [Varibaculum cambriense]|uniref:Bacterial group 3 Ig-like protein n=1 Tax=Varibaculum cambriense TaxID=184870 RepID=A0AB34X2H0_9ACTO|nr:bacterial Ig-like domain-containing protein [Varibaculum cambriense]KXB81166.1 bacterial group 3 Ig-like protein [Varibaculum cambriense]
MTINIRRAIGFMIASLLLVGMGLLSAIHPQMANAQENNAGDIKIEILPEIFLTPDEGADKALFSKPGDTIGVRRSADVYGGPIPSAKVLEAWKNIAFQVYDQDGKLIETTKGTIGHPKRWSGAKYLGPYPQGKTYTVKVDPSTVPDGYYSWFTPKSSRMDEARGGKTDVMTVSDDFQSATNAKENANPVAETRFHLDIVQIAYVKNPEVAKDLLPVIDGKVTEINPKYKEGRDYFLKPIGKNGKLNKLSSTEADKLASEGYMPTDFYFEDKQGRGSYQEIDQQFRRVGYSFLWRWSQDDGVNRYERFRTSSVFTVILDQKIPEVTFYKGAPQAGKEPEVLTTQKVYYRHSLGTNCLSDGTTCLPKKLPAAPAAPAGQVFKEWNTKADGSGQSFNAETVVMADMAVYPVYRPNTPPVLEVKDATITVGDKLDLRSLITKAFDEEDGADLAGKVVIEKGKFDPTKPGTYEVKFTLTDINGESVSATAKITVKEAAKTKTPQPDSKVKQQMPPTGAAGISALGIALACLLAGIAATAGARMSRKR